MKVKIVWYQSLSYTKFSKYTYNKFIHKCKKRSFSVCTDSGANYDTRDRGNPSHFDLSVDYKRRELLETGAAPSGRGYNRNAAQIELSSYLSRLRTFATLCSVAQKVQRDRSFMHLERSQENTADECALNHIVKGLRLP